MRLALRNDLKLKLLYHGVVPRNEPEIQRLTAQYGLEAQNFDPRIAQSAPPTLRQRFIAITAKFREVLQLQRRASRIHAMIHRGYGLTVMHDEVMAVQDMKTQKTI